MIWCDITSDAIIFTYIYIFYTLHISYLYSVGVYKCILYFIYILHIFQHPRHTMVCMFSHPTHNSARPSKKQFIIKAANSVPLILTHNTYGLAYLHIHNRLTPHTRPPTRNFARRKTTFSISMAAKNFLLILTHHTYDFAHVHVHNFLTPHTQPCQTNNDLFNQ